MKKNIHPENYRLVVFKDTSCDHAFLTRSTVETKEKIKWDNIGFNDNFACLGPRYINISSRKDCRGADSFLNASISIFNSAISVRSNPSLALPWRWAIHTEQ